MIETIDKDSLVYLKGNILSIEKIKAEFSNNPYAKYIVYKSGNNIIGYIYYSNIYERIEINQIEVEKEYRNKKIASKLMMTLIKKENKPITLEVKKDNIAAINLYKKYGFKEKAIRKGYYHGVDGILMEKAA